MQPYGEGMTSTVDPAAESVTAEAYAERLFAASLNTYETFSTYVGLQLGWFAALAERPMDDNWRWMLGRIWARAAGRSGKAIVVGDAQLCAMTVAGAAMVKKAIAINTVRII